MGRAHVAISNETVADVLGRITSNVDLRGLFAYHWGNYGLPPSQASWAIHAMVRMCLPTSINFNKPSAMCTLVQSCLGVVITHHVHTVIKTSLQLFSNPNKIKISFAPCNI